MIVNFWNTVDPEDRYEDFIEDVSEVIFEQNYVRVFKKGDNEPWEFNFSELISIENEER